MREAQALGGSERTAARESGPAYSRCGDAARGVTRAVASRGLLGCSRPVAPERERLIPRRVSLHLPRMERAGANLKIGIGELRGTTLYSPSCESLERRVGRGWRLITHTHGAILACGLVLVRTSSLRISDFYQLPEDLIPGTYRLEFGYSDLISSGKENEHSVSGHLRVLPRAKPARRPSVRLLLPQLMTSLW